MILAVLLSPEIPVSLVILMVIPKAPSITLMIIAILLSLVVPVTPAVSHNPEGSTADGPDDTKRHQ